jgi:hypothetical protein
VAAASLSALVALAAAGQARAADAHPAEGAAPATCIVHSLPSFIAQGEGLAEPEDNVSALRVLTTAASVADVVEVECNPSIYGAGSNVKITASQLFSRCKGRLTWYVPNPYRVEQGKGVSVELDADGNATVALLAGPECMAGESLIAVHLEEQPFETFTTSFTVLPPMTSPPGVYALPAAQVEDALSSGVAAIVEAEFENGSEKLVHLGSEELFHRCRVAPHLHWIRMDRSEQSDVPEVTGVRLDNDGNAFVIVIGDASCAPGASLIEADLESKPFTTFTTTFTTQPPQPTAEPAFTIEKRQQIAGSGGSFTAMPLTASLNETVNYEIIVKNTGTVPETFGELSDTHCEAISGGPGTRPLQPGEAATYTCLHVLSAVGTYTNEATITATTVGGLPLTQTSNRVEVSVPPKSPPPSTPNKTGSFTVEKPQEGPPSVQTLPFKCTSVLGRLQGVSGSKNAAFTAKISAKEVEQVTFSLDHHRLGTFTHAQAKHERFGLRIDPRRLSYGRHRVIVDAVMSNPLCRPNKTVSAFVHSRPPSVPPKIAG